MRALYSGGDYYLYLDSGELEKIVVPTRNLSPMEYPFFNSYTYDVNGNKTGEWLAVTCTNDASAAQEPNGIRFERTEYNPRDIIVRVFTPRMMKQEELNHYSKENRPDFETIYTQGFLMTRYDGHSDKIWIYPSEPLGL